jgi:hypothetical protein
VHRALGKIADGNRSAAVEFLVREYLERNQSSVPEPA